MSQNESSIMEELMVRNSSNLAQSNPNSSQGRGESWKENHYITIFIPASSELDHLKAALEALFFSLLCHCIEMLYNCSCKRSHPFSCMWEGKRCITHCEFDCAEWAKSNQLDTFFVITICFTYRIGIPAHDRFVRLKTWPLVIFSYSFISVLAPCAQHLIFLSFKVVIALIEISSILDW